MSGVRIGARSWTAEQWEGLRHLTLYGGATLPAGTVLPAGEVEA